MGCGGRGLLGLWPNGTGVERLCFGFLLAGDGGEELAPAGAPAVQVMMLKAR